MKQSAPLQAAAGESAAHSEDFANGLLNQLNKGLVESQIIRTL